MTSDDSQINDGITHDELEALAGKPIEAKVVLYAIGQRLYRRDGGRWYLYPPQGG